MAPIAATAGAAHTRILGLGSYRPSRLVPNAEVVDAIDSSDEWIQQRSGIKTRRWATPEETIQVMSVGAAREAIERAGLVPEQIDCVIDATVTHLLQPGAPIGEVASLRDRTEIRAPHGGSIVEWLVEDGDLVSPGQPLLRLHPEASL